MGNKIQTGRLVLSRLNLDDAHFMYELVNTADWIKNIGDRNVQSVDDAQNYVQKIIDNPNVSYWAVKLQSEMSSLGIVTLIKRDYLEHHDIGFAFLPQYTKHGYAHEATKAVLEQIIKDQHHDRILAITIPDNSSSIRLLEKLGLVFDSTIQPEAEQLLCYSIATID
jgi:RimJ/RimL family protein N-acetyltransferase